MFMEEQPCVGVFVRLYDRDTHRLAGQSRLWCRTYLHEKHTHKHSSKYAVLRCSGLALPSFETDVHIASYPFRHKCSYLCELCVNVGFIKEALPLPICGTLIDWTYMTIPTSVSEQWLTSQYRDTSYVIFMMNSMFYSNFTTKTYPWMSSASTAACDDTLPG